MQNLNLEEEEKYSEVEQLFIELDLEVELVRPVLKQLGIKTFKHIQFFEKEMMARVKLNKNQLTPIAEKMFIQVLIEQQQLRFESASNLQVSQTVQDGKQLTLTTSHEALQVSQTSQDEKQLTHEPLQALTNTLEKTSSMATDEKKASKPATKLPKLPEYKDNESTPILKLLDTVEITLTANGIEPTRWNVALATCFADAAPAWAKTNLLETGISWAEAREITIQHFLASNVNEFALDLIASAEQQGDESVTAYESRFVSYLVMASIAVTTLYYIKQFVRGLRPQLREAVLRDHRVKPLRSVHEAAEHARGIERDQKLCNTTSQEETPRAGKRQLRRPRNQQQEEPQLQSREDQQKECTIHGKGFHSSSECRVLKARDKQQHNAEQKPRPESKPQVKANKANVGAVDVATSSTVPQAEIDFVTAKSVEAEALFAFLQSDSDTEN